MASTAEAKRTACPAPGLQVDIHTTILQNNGVLLAIPAMVSREMYSGRDIIAPNSAFTADKVDHRNYVPVEWWIMSCTQAQNGVMKDGEGITRLRLASGNHVPLSDALLVCEKDLFGDYATKWPLTKVLDIGGRAVKPSFVADDASADSKEVPPIPCHVHAGLVCNGHCQGPGKLEAYFFPPLNVPPYNLELSNVITRLGLKPDTTQEDVVKCLKRFGEDDSMYQLLNVFDIQPWESWTIQEKVVHAPGPWLTFEIQRPQDDYNLLAWRLGHALQGEAKESLRSSTHLRGLADDEALLRETIDWEMNTDPDFESKWHTKCQVLSSGDWGRQTRLFYHDFYGEGFEILPGHSFTRPKGPQPIAGIVWSGSGSLNGLPVSAVDDESREFLVCPQFPCHIENPESSSSTLIVFTVFPMLD
ncbi:uncharacterized protein LOC135818546 isoform X1 [Sycon ciliatum]|uniref:uncharacterized protein LOC135818546 isoform X1 n=1 Tax=Sycon ciliatum TaxID=27933 RepID=UPI0031F61FD5